MTRPLPDAPREQHEAYAEANGFFWLPCPRCGRLFGGHEIANGEGGHWWTSANAGNITCPKCPGEYNTEAMKIEDPPTILISINSTPPHERN